MKQRLMIVAVVVAALFGVVALVAARSQDDDAVATLVVKAGPFDRRVTAEGFFEAEKSTAVSAPAEAREPMKIAWMIEDQSLVKAGDVLVQFDPSDFEKTLQTGTSDREKADNKIFKVDVEAMATSRNLQRDVGQAEAELESARTFAAKDVEIFTRYDVVESAIEEELAGERREYARRVQQIRAQLASADRDLQAIEQRKADLKIKQAQSGLKALMVTAPHDGLIVFKRDWRGELPRVGSTVWAGYNLGEIPAMDKMRAQLFVLESDAGGIEVGQKAIVRPDSDPSREYSGTVEQVDKIAKPRVRGVPVQYFGVRLKLDKHDALTMKPGARLRATIELARSNDAITIPRQALFDKGGAKLVYVKKGDKFEPRTVTTGVFSAGKVLIKSGLKANEEIALEDPTIKEGTAEKDGKDSSA